MKTKIVSLIASAVVAGALSASPAVADEQFGNDHNVNVETNLQVAGYYDRARAYIRHMRRRRVRIGGNGVRG